MNVFRDVEKFMRASDQSVIKYNPEQVELYLNLIKEEADSELSAAVKADDRVAMLDALVDTLVVTIGAIHSMGADPDGAWKEVMRTNFSKIDSKTGKVRKREDGKVLKPVGWTGPDLEPFLTKTS